MTERIWTPLGRRAVSEHRILRVREDRYRFEPSRDESDFVVIEAPDWVNVIAVTENDEVVLIRQFRHGVACDTLEIPGGIVDPGESPAEAALRELEEETGYVADRTELLGSVWPNPAIQDNTLHMFLAQRVRPSGTISPDPHEQIDVVTTPRALVRGLVLDGEIRHALVVAAFGVMGWLAPVDQAPPA